MLTTRLIRELAAKTNFQRMTPARAGADTAAEDRTNRDQMRPAPSGSIYRT